MLIYNTNTMCLQNMSTRRRAPNKYHDVTIMNVINMYRGTICQVVY